MDTITKSIQKESYQILKEFDKICKKHDIKYSLGFGTLIGAIRHSGFIPWDDDIDLIMPRSEYNRLLTIIDKELIGTNYTFFDDTKEKHYYYSFGKIRSNQLEIPEESTQYTGINQGVWIDIFPYDNISDDKQEQLNQFQEVARLHKKFVVHLFTHATDKDSSMVKIVKSSFKLINRLSYRINPFLKIWNKERYEILTKFNSDNTEFSACLSDNMPTDDYLKSKLKRTDFEDTIEWTFEDQLFPIIRNYDNHLTSFYGDYMKEPPKHEQVSVHQFSKK